MTNILIPLNWKVGEIHVDNENLNLMILLANWGQENDCISDETRSYFLQFSVRFSTLLLIIEEDMEKNNYPMLKQVKEENKNILFHLKKTEEKQFKKLFEKCRQALINEIVQTKLYYTRYKDESFILKLKFVNAN